jgi:hypothetical protein
MGEEKQLRNNEEISALNLKIKQLENGYKEFEQQIIKE